MNWKNQKKLMLRAKQGKFNVPSCHQPSIIAYTLYLVFIVMIHIKVYKYSPRLAITQLFRVWPHPAGS